LRDDQLTKLAYAGAMASFGLTRRGALWQASYAAKQAGELFEEVHPETTPHPPPAPSPTQDLARSIDPVALSPSQLHRDGERVPKAGEGRSRANSPLPEMSAVETTMADYGAMELTTGRHLLEHFRPQLRKDGVLSAMQLKHVPDGSRVVTAGAVIVRQRPGTAKGFVFLTLEDETGLSQAIVTPQLFADERTTILNNSGLIVEGIVQNQEGQASVRAEKFWPLPGIDNVSSYDFH
jgi:error-prone DNA polymerase